MESESHLTPSSPIQIVTPTSVSLHYSRESRRPAFAISKKYAPPRNRIAPVASTAGLFAGGRGARANYTGGIGGVFDGKTNTIIEIAYVNSLLLRARKTAMWFADEKFNVLEYVHKVDRRFGMAILILRVLVRPRRTRELRGQDRAESPIRESTQRARAHRLGFSRKRQHFVPCRCVYNYLHWPCTGSTYGKLFE